MPAYSRWPQTLLRERCPQEGRMKAAVIAGAASILAVLSVDVRPSHAQMMGWGMGMCREGYVYEPSRNVCVHKSKKAKRPTARRKSPQ
jgi:hypothetical protein